MEWLKEQDSYCIYCISRHPFERYDLQRSSIDPLYRRIVSETA